MDCKLVLLAPFTHSPGEDASGVMHYIIFVPFVKVSSQSTLRSTLRRLSAAKGFKNIEPVSTAWSYASD